MMQALHERLKRSGPAWSCVVLCWLALQAGGRAAQEPGPGEDLLRAALVAESDDERAFLDRIAPLGARAVVPLIRAAAHGYEGADGAPRELTRSQLAGFERLVGELSPQALRIELGAIGPEADLVERSMAAAILADIAGAQDLRRLSRLVAPRRSVPTPQLRASFGRALERVLRSDELERSELRGLVFDVPPCLWTTAVRTMGALRDPVLLGELLGRATTLDVLVLEEIARAANPSGRVHDEFLRSRVRSLLEHNDETCVRAATRACVALDDVTAVGDLVRLARDPREAVADAAQAALATLARDGQPRTAAGWAVWHDEQRVWWEGGAAHRALSDALSGPPERAVRALLGIAPRRLYRHDLTEEMEPCLGRPEVQVVALAASVLGELGSPSAWPALVELLRHPSAEVQGAARNALARIFQARGSSGR